MQERTSGRRVTEREARWIAQKEVGPDLNLLRAENPLIPLSPPKPPSLTEISESLKNMADERTGLLQEKKQLKGVSGAGQRRHELADRINQLKLDMNTLKRQIRKLDR